MRGNEREAAQIALSRSDVADSWLVHRRFERNFGSRSLRDEISAVPGQKTFLCEKYHELSEKSASCREKSRVVVRNLRVVVRKLRVVVRNLAKLARNLAR